MIYRAGKNKKARGKPSPPLDPKLQDGMPDSAIATELDDNIRIVTQLFGDSSDLIVRNIGYKSHSNAAVIYLESLVDKAIIDEFVVEPLNEQLRVPDGAKQYGSFDVGDIRLSTNKLDAVSEWKEISRSLLLGNSIVFVEGHVQALVAGTAGGQRRSVSEPTAEAVVRGPRESFNESLQTNVGLVRRRLQTHKLRVESMQIGALSNTPVAIMHIEGVAKAEIVEEVKKRLGIINIDGILESQYIEEFIEDPQGYSPFPTIFNTERPDRISANLLEGRVAILVEGTPVALIVPATITLFLYSNEDYYQRYDIATFLKLLRTAAFILSFTMPGFYVALLTFHQEMLPTPLLIALTGQREGVPFGIAIEVALMEITFEILREAGVRLPKTIGSAVSIVGGLVLGQAAVEAGLIGPGTIITVSITAIASFVTPSYNMAISGRLIRFFVLLLSATLGAFGFFFAIILVFIHLNTLRSFGIPYLSSFTPFHKSDWKDLFVRAPWPKMKRRPEEVAGENDVRIGEERK
jgi:spore germination protein KA